MIFHRTQTPPKYADYSRYRPYLRQDFCCRCAYCLRHEGHNGGEANFCIDHYCPVHGPYGRPELECEYSNLYYACSECNEYKSDEWPDEAQRQLGYRFLDPCQAEDDHDLHFRSYPDGRWEPVSAPGTYTNVTLVLWRPGLKHWRARMYRLQAEVQAIETQLLTQITGQKREELERKVQELYAELEPPVFDRPRGAERRSGQEML